jgi:ubiquinol-cytochrome c reductase cytochrome b subunit
MKMKVFNYKFKLRKLKIIRFLKNHLINYPTPATLNYFWGFGLLISFFSINQIITGIMLAMHYSPNILNAFDSVEHIMRDVSYGWLLRYFHANGASFMFICLYFHLFKGLYYSSYIKPYHFLWKTGVLLFILTMATAFMGYVLPFGQMSFWGATVIINLFSAIPYVGSSIVYWLLGGYSVENATLNRFFSIHYLLPFIIAGFSILHLSLLHLGGSSNPLGIYKKISIIPFYPYYYLKDLLGLFGMLFFFIIIVFFYPNLLGHSDNYIEANPLVTPLHIVPEWYFLPFYAILRSIPNKLGGVFCMGFALVILFLLPYLYNKFFSIIYTIFNKPNSKETSFYLSFNLFFNKTLHTSLKEKQKIFFNKTNKKTYFRPLYNLLPEYKFIKIFYIIKSPKFRFFYQLFFWIFFFNLILLGIVGGNPVEIPYIFLGQVFTFIYFAYFILLIPLSFFIDSLTIKYK